MHGTVYTERSAETIIRIYQGPHECLERSYVVVTRGLENAILNEQVVLPVSVPDNRLLVDKPPE